jgi:hypothetical protein
MIIHSDSSGAIVLANIEKITSQNKHIDTQYYFMQDYIRDKIIKINYMFTKLNFVNIFTKNLGLKSFNNIVTHYLADLE